MLSHQYRRIIPYDYTGYCIVGFYSVCLKFPTKYINSDTNFSDCSSLNPAYNSYMCIIFIKSGCTYCEQALNAAEIMIAL